MRVIDVNKIDEWLFDYFEGNLNVEEKSKLIGFLHNHPHLQADYEAWKVSYVHEPEIQFPGIKNLLIGKSYSEKWMKWGGSLAIVIGLLYYFLHAPIKTSTNNKSFKKSKKVEVFSKQEINFSNSQTSLKTENKTSLIPKKTVSLFLTLKKKKINKTAKLPILSKENTHQLKIEEQRSSKDSKENDMSAENAQIINTIKNISKSKIQVEKIDTLRTIVQQQIITNTKEIDPEVKKLKESIPKERKKIKIIPINNVGF